MSKNPDWAPKALFPNVGGLSLADLNSYGYNAFPGEPPLTGSICNRLLCPRGMTSFVQPIPDHTGRKLVAYIGVGPTGVELVYRRFASKYDGPERPEVMLVFRGPDGSNTMLGLSYADFDYCMDRLELEDITEPTFYALWQTTSYLQNR